MQKFQYPQYLQLLWLLIPLVILIVWYIRWRDKTIKTYFGDQIRDIIFPNGSNLNRILKYILILGAVTMMIIGIANPQKGIKEEKVKGRGIDIMILLDVSNSMLAQDIQPNRLERSKLFISGLLDKLENDRVGLVIFAGNAFQQVPITMDYSALKINLPLIDPTSIPSQGTNIGEAVAMGQRALGLTQSQSKAIIVLTDGEDHDQSSEAAILEAKKNGIKVFAIGVGTTEGAQIPMGNDVKRDESGNPVVSAFNQKMLENLAAIGNGSFYQLGMQSDITEEVVSKLKKIESKEFEEFDFSNYNSYFYWFLLIALILLFVEFVLPDVDFKTFLKKSSLIIFITLSFSIVNAQTKDELAKKQKAQTFIRKGNVAYQNGKFQDAELNYRKSLAENSKNTTAKYNLANTLYEQKKYKESAELLETAKKEFQDKPSRARSLHNAGNAHYKGGDMKKAIKSYEDALKLNPSDAETKFNLAMAKKEKKNQGGGGQNKQKNQKQDQKKDGDKKENGQKQEDEGQDGNDPKPEMPKPGQMSRDEAQKLLDALKNQEQNTQKKVDQQRQKPEQKKHEKDW